MSTVDKNEVQTICNSLSDISGSLKGISGLFSQLSPQACLESEELFGLGQLLGSLAGELVRIEGLLRNEADRTEKVGL